MMRGAGALLRGLGVMRFENLGDGGGRREAGEHLFGDLLVQFLGEDEGGGVLNLTQRRKGAKRGWLGRFVTRSGDRVTTGVRTGFFEVVAIAGDVRREDIGRQRIAGRKERIGRAGRGGGEVMD
jgi:hypothetical protein